MWLGDHGKRAMTLFSFKKHFGGPASTKQKLEDLGRNLPAWSQPVWKWLVAVLVHWIQQLKISAELKEVDEQVEQINESWNKIEAQDRLMSAEEIAAEIRKTQPDAIVIVVEVPIEGGDKDAAIMIDHPKDGSKAQDVLGGAMEIRNPWVDR
jgi:hypothetical protein